MPRCSGAPVRLLVAVLLLAGGPAAAQTNDEHATATKKARRAAASWLALVDADAFAASWDSAAALLQKRIKREIWVRKAQRLRDTVQALSARTLTTTQYRDSLRRAPSEGPFVVLKYRSSFGAGRFEEVLLTVRQDTTWKVAGYQVTPLRPPEARSPIGPPKAPRP